MSSEDLRLQMCKRKARLRSLRLVTVVEAVVKLGLRHPSQTFSTRVSGAMLVYEEFLIAIHAESFSQCNTGDRVGRNDGGTKELKARFRVDVSEFESRIGKQ